MQLVHTTKRRKANWIG